MFELLVPFMYLVFTNLLAYLKAQISQLDPKWFKFKRVKASPTILEVTIPANDLSQERNLFIHNEESWLVIEISRAYTTYFPLGSRHCHHLFLFILP